MRMSILFAAAALLGLTPLGARAEGSCHLAVIKGSGEFPAWVKAGGSCRVNRNHTPGAASSLSKAPDHGTFDLQENYWSYAPAPGFKGRDTFAYAIAGKRSSIFITIDMDVR